MSKRNDWLRNDRWDEADQRAFFQRLDRSRGAFKRLGYLEGKAIILAKTGEPSKIEAAVQLRLQVCREAEQEAEKLAPNEAKFYIRWAMNAQAAIGHIRQGQGRFDEAILHYRDALRRQNGEAPDFYITRLARALYKTKRIDEYPEILDLLDRSFKRNQDALMIFRQAFFEYGFYQAVLSFEIGRIEAAKAYARGASTILRAPDHGIGQNLAAGTIRVSDEERAELQRILNSPSVTQPSPHRNSPL